MKHFFQIRSHQKGQSSGCLAEQCQASRKNNEARTSYLKGVRVFISYKVTTSLDISAFYIL